jgi:hypothetical protein
MVDPTILPMRMPVNSSDPMTSSLRTLFVKLELVPDLEDEDDEPIDPRLGVRIREVWLPPDWRPRPGTTLERSCYLRATRSAEAAPFTSALGG